MMSEGHREITYIAHNTENSKLPSISEFLLRALYILSIKQVLYSYSFCTHFPTRKMSIKIFWLVPFEEDTNLISNLF